MRNSRRTFQRLYFILEYFLQMFHLETTTLVQRYSKCTNRRKRDVLLDNARCYSVLTKLPLQVKHMDRLMNVTDYDCVANLRMDWNTFGRLCHVLSNRCGLITGKCVGVEEQVAMFVTVLAHHQKNRVVKFQFWRSGSTVSHYDNKVLGVVLSLHGLLLSKPEAVPADCSDHRWRWFKGCLGALDGTHINVLVSSTDKPRYRTRKGQIAMNTLAVCDRDMQFVFVLPGWEGSAGDSRVLRDAVAQEGGLWVPQGCYYLYDNGYANSNGFLTPYKGVRYHLKEWGLGNAAPQNPKELFNIRHTQARNIIERAFVVLKMHWGIFRCASYYPIKTQIRLIMACFLLHNFIRREMPNGPIEAQLDPNVDYTANVPDQDGPEFVDHVEPSAEWTQFRDDLANAMWLHRQRV